MEDTCFLFCVIPNSKRRENEQLRKEVPELSEKEL